MSSTEVQQHSFHQKWLKCFQPIIESNKDIIGLVTTTKEMISLELHCLFCSDVFDDLLVYLAHINSKHSSSLDNKKLLPKYTDGIYCAENDPLSEIKENFERDTAVNGNAVVVKEEINGSKGGNRFERLVSENHNVTMNLLDMSSNQINKYSVKEEQKKEEGSTGEISEQENDFPAFELVKVSLGFENYSGAKNKQGENKKGQLTQEEVEQTNFLIDAFKEYAVLWDSQASGFTSAVAKKRAYVEIADAFNKKFHSKLCGLDVKRKIARLRATCQKAASRLWYFDKLSFCNLAENTKSSRKCSILEKPGTEQIDLNSIQQFKDEFDVNSYFIDIYKSCQCLWDEQNTDYMNSEKRREAHEILKKSIKDKWNINLSDKMLQEKISSIQFLCGEEISKTESNETKPWYHSKLLFLKAKSKTETYTESTDYKCEFCNDLFKTELSLKNHLSKSHRIKSFACKICNMKFSQKGNCSMHERRHTKSFSHSCNLCGKNFFTSVEVKNHMRIHTDEKPFVCDECGKAFRTYSKMKTHQQTHNKDRTFKCTICPMAFYTREVMKKHIRSHSDVRNYECDVCGKCFKAQKTLRQHQQLHSDEKKYSCKVCGQLFSQRAGLHAHMKTHITAHPV